MTGEFVYLGDSGSASRSLDCSCEIRTIVILDEATSALDSVIEQGVAAGIKRRLTGHTLIVIAHRLSTIRDADLILVFEGGRIVESGTWGELIERGGAFHELYRAQSEKHTPVEV